MAGRGRGKNRGKPLSEAERRQRAEAARKRRGLTPDIAARDQLEEARNELRAGLPAGARRIRSFLEIGGDPMTFLKAFEIAAGRAGLPPLAQQEIIGAPAVLILERANHEKPNGDKS
jgi:hypothetical protein